MTSAAAGPPEGTVLACTTSASAPNPVSVSATWVINCMLQSLPWRSSMVAFHRAASSVFEVVRPSALCVGRFPTSRLHFCQAFHSKSPGGSISPASIACFRVSVLPETSEEVIGPNPKYQKNLVLGFPGAAPNCVRPGTASQSPYT